MRNTEAARRGGKTQGAANVASGHWQRIKDTVSKSEAAKIAGRIALETGQIHTIQNHEASIRGGKTQGKAALESGQWDEVRPKGLHVRWHIKAGQLPKKYCQFCPPELNKNFSRTAATR